MDEHTLPQGTEGQDVPTTSTDTNPYVADEKFRTIEVEYTEQKFTLAHNFVCPDNRDLVKYYLAAPSVKSNSKGEVKLLGQPSAPAAKLHDEICGGMKMLTIAGELKKEFTLEQIREMRQSVKADGVVSFIGSYYDVELSVESGEMDDLLFDRATQLTATVKTRPFASGKVDKVFKIFLNRQDDLTFDRFVSHSSGTSLIDKNDSLLTEFLGEDNLAEMTGGVDEGERIAFSKTTQYVRQFIDAFDKAFDGAENVLVEGQEYSAGRRNAFIQAIDPVLKVQISSAMRNFM
jgi:hypothetical protein